MIHTFLDQASTFAGDIDEVIFVIALLAGFWFVLAEIVFFWLTFRYRARPGQKADYITGKEKHLKRWINYPHYLIIACDVVIIVFAVRVWYVVKQDKPPGEDLVRVVGQQWAWSFVHAGRDGKLDTDDDIKTVDELHVRTDTLYNFQLESRDVLHSFSIPVFRLKQDAIPGRRIEGWFEATQPGEYDLQCAEMCGIGHGLMAARIFVETPEAHDKWVAANTN